MDWQQSVLDASARALAETGLPRRLLRRLLVDHGFGVGSRMLVIGCENARLLAALDELGLDVVGMDACEEHVRQVAADAPDLDVRPLPETGPLPFAERSLDLVLLAGCRSRPAAPRELPVTADWLSLLRPRGCFAAIAATSEAADEHAFEQWLGLFPGDVAVEEFGTAPFAPWSWIRSARAAARGAFLLATLRTPAEPLTRRQWRCLANVARETESVFEAMRRPAA